MEEKRPGEYFPVFEDEQGTYILNSRDMCMIDHLDDLLDVGLSSLKIEGRAKSAYYAAIVTGAYRHCLDDAAAGQPRRSRCGGTRWSTSATGPTPPASITASPASTTKIPAISGNGRWWRWSRTVTATGNAVAVPAEQVPHRGHGGAGRARICGPFP